MLTVLADFFELLIIWGLFGVFSLSLSLVIKAKVVGQKEVVTGNDNYGNPIKKIQYDIKQMKVCFCFSTAPFLQQKKLSNSKIIQNLIN